MKTVTINQILSMAKDVYSIPKRHNHDHFWIKDGVMYESYNTLRGRRYMEVMEVDGIPDEDKCNNDCLAYIAKEFFK